MGVNGRPTRAWALSTDSETVPCSDQPKESSAAPAKVEAAIATVLRLIGFMAFLQCLSAPSSNAALSRCLKTRSFGRERVRSTCRLQLEKGEDVRRVGNHRSDGIHESIPSLKSRLQITKAGLPLKIMS